LQRQFSLADPIGFIHSLPEFVILDEVQRVPELFTSIKMSVDNNRKAGRFILIASANILLLPKLADSLAGRMEIIHLRPLSCAEIANHQPDFLKQLFAADFGQAANRNQYRRLGESLTETIVKGSYPTALARPTEKRSANWYRDYITTIVQRDVQDLTRIQKLEMLPRLLGMAAEQTSRLFNVSSLGSSFALSTPTIR